MVITAVLERHTGLLIFANWHYRCSIQLDAPWEIRQVLDKAVGVKCWKVFVQLRDRDRGAGQTRDTIEADQFRFCLLHCQECLVRCLRPVQDKCASPCLFRDAKCAVVWHADMHPLDLAEESCDLEAWPVTTVYSKVGVAVLAGMLDATRCLKAACSTAAARHFRRKLNCCESTLADALRMLEKETGDCDAGSDAVSL